MPGGGPWRRPRRRRSATPPAPGARPRGARRPLPGESTARPPSSVSVTRPEPATPKICSVVFPIMSRNDWAAPAPRRSPSAPPATPTTAASARKRACTCRGVAPRERSVPMSRLRRFTATWKALKMRKVPMPSAKAGDVEAGDEVRDQALEVFAPPVGGFDPVGGAQRRRQRARALLDGDVLFEADLQPVEAPPPPEERLGRVDVGDDEVAAEGLGETLGSEEPPDHHPLRRPAGVLNGENVAELHPGALGQRAGHDHRIGLGEEEERDRRCRRPPPRSRSRASPGRPGGPRPAPGRSRARASLGDHDLLDDRRGGPDPGEFADRLLHLLRHPALHGDLKLGLARHAVDRGADAVGERPLGAPDGAESGHAHGHAQERQQRLGLVASGVGKREGAEEKPHLQPVPFHPPVPKLDEPLAGRGGALVVGHHDDGGLRAPGGWRAGGSVSPRPAPCRDSRWARRRAGAARRSPGRGRWRPAGAPRPKARRGGGPRAPRARPPQSTFADRSSISARDRPARWSGSATFWLAVSVGIRW